MYARIIGGLLIVIAIIIFISVAYRNSPKSTEPVIFSNRSMLESLWHYHKVAYIEAQSGRTIDQSRGNASTSEAEGYDMLRAVWLDDKTAFDQSWSWTQKTLQHKNSDNLFSWYYSKLPSGNFGIDTLIGGENSASDADTDIALALVFAHDRWPDDKYLSSAQGIIQGIWDSEVVIIKNKPYLAASNLEKTSASPSILVNPSYFSPYAYKIFAKYDPQHDWKSLADNSYTVLIAAMDSKLDKSGSAGLPPNWIDIDKNTAAIKATGNPQLTTEYSFDAIRVPFRIALDWDWFQDPRAKEVLSKMSFLEQQWQQNHAIYTTYGHDGSINKQEEAPAIYGTNISYFIINDPGAAAEIFDNKLKILYNPDNDSWKEQLSYYDDAWAWFGMALYTNTTINLEQNNA